MTFEEQKKKLGTLPWQALYDLAISKEVDEAEVNGKDKDTIITLQQRKAKKSFGNL